MNAALTATRGAAIPKNPAPVENLSRPYQDYFADIVQQPFSILGLKLRPLSLGRYRLMKRFEIAFVCDEAAAATVDDLLLGILICAMRVDDFLEFSNAADFEKQVRLWAVRIKARSPFEGRPLLHGIWNKLFGRRWRARHGFNVLEKIKLFQRYIQDNSHSPRYWDESENNRSSGAHWAHSAEVVLRGQVGWTRDEINEEPLNKAIWDFYKHMESQGLIRLMTADEIEYLDTPASPEEELKLKEWAEALKKAGIGQNQLN